MIPTALPPYRSRICDWIVASSLPLAGVDVAADTVPDIVIREAPVPGAADARAGGANRTIVGACGNARMDLYGVCAVLMTSACEVIVERVPGIADALIASTMTGAVLDLICLRRGLVPLHAAAVATPAGAVLITGASGAGKSTTLAGLAARGHAVLTDDTAVIDPATLEVVPSTAGMKLTDDAARRLGLDAARLLRLNGDAGKLILMPDRVSTRRQLPLAIVVLEAGDGETIDRLPSGAAVAAILGQIRGGHLLAAFGRPGIGFQVATRLVAAVPVWRVTRPRAGDLSRLLDRLTPIFAAGQGLPSD
ncbi:hypothetical protein P7L78_06510 [Tistrella bauzanensis]|uniref:HPr kinase/phosphorylase C-terminal domain-containing protein n=1 Tax=Tistrella arctica TaxID=3133430 RepID=A0ABU9YFD7_9PROT